MSHSKTKPGKDIFNIMKKRKVFSYEARLG